MYEIEWALLGKEFMSSLGLYTEHPAKEWQSVAYCTRTKDTIGVHVLAKLVLQMVMLTHQ